MSIEDYLPDNIPEIEIPDIEIPTIDLFKQINSRRYIQPVSINGIEFDALIEQTPTFESVIPEYPTERGYGVSDHIIIKPVTLELTVLLTNTPVTWATRFGESVNRVKNVTDKLLQLWVDKEIVTVVTNDAIYYDMGIESLKLPKKVETGSSIEIPMTFKQIEYTQTQTVITPSYLRAGTTGQKAGTTKTKKSTDPKKQDSTLAYKLIHGGLIDRMIGGQ